MQGVANDASIVAVQVFSFDTQRRELPTAYTQGQSAAMDAVMRAMTPGTTNNPYTVNSSIAGGNHVTICPYVDQVYQNAVTVLYGWGVPVVASTGNQSNRGLIGFPSCMKNVIKVGALQNFGYGTTIIGSSLGDPANWPGDYSWLAPGYGVISAGNANSPQYMPLGGTSQAAPHVAGVHALIKSAFPEKSVLQLSQWIETREPQSGPMNAAADDVAAV